ncbi:cytoplasmic protein [bacterium]|nr:cytoplasmic protein [bacterium]
MGKNEKGIRFEVDRANLYREEAYTDLKSASIRRLTPVTKDGSDDNSRPVLYFGHAELISPQGPIPIQSELNADCLEKAIEALPAAMEKAAFDVREEYNKMVEQQRQQHEQQSKVIKSGE